MSINEPHPQLGNGVLTRLNLPLSLDRETAAELAASLNQLELKTLTRAHQLGAWCAASVGGSETVVFASFLPNVMHKPGFLTEMLLAMGLRARWAAAVLEAGTKSGSVIDIVAKRLL